MLALRLAPGTRINGWHTGGPNPDAHRLTCVVGQEVFVERSELALAPIRLLLRHVQSRSIQSSANAAGAHRCREGVRGARW